MTTARLAAAQPVPSREGQETPLAALVPGGGGQRQWPQPAWAQALELFSSKAGATCTSGAEVQEHPQSSVGVREEFAAPSLARTLSSLPYPGLA